jgi:hypothetical protein
MNLDEQLRTVLGEEADMRAVPRPDIDGLIQGGRVRRRRRNVTRLGAAAAAVVLLGGTAYGVARTALDDPRSVPEFVDQPDEAPDASPSAAPPRYPGTGGIIEVGSYWVPVLPEGSRTPITATLTFESPAWRSMSQPVISDSATGTYGGLGVVQPVSVAGGATGCTNDSRGTRRPAAPTAQRLVDQLTRLPGSTVVQAPSTTSLLGYGAVRLRLHVEAGCPEPEYYLVADGEGDFGITRSYGGGPVTVVLDLWVLDVGGTPVLVASWYEQDAPRSLVDEVNGARSSLRLTEGGPG